MKREDIFYRALLARDHRFDGKFFVGVKTTGIYCRPICPAKPLRKNIEFFADSLSAERAGYRPCLRCRPESAPRSPAWIGTSALVQRAIKKLQISDAAALNENEFAMSFGVSARHLRRLFVEEIGKTPKQIALENRLGLARKLLVESALPVTEVAFASGFRSIRRFNDAFKARFKRNPSEIRRGKGKKTSASLTLSLAYRPPFDFAGLIYFYRTHPIGDMEWFEGETMYRVVALGGKVGTIAISDHPSHCQLEVEIDFPDTSAIPTILSQVRNMFDLDSDPVIVANVLETDPELRRLLDKHRGIRLPSGWNGFEVAISTILGQLVSVKQGRQLVADLIDLLGKDSGLKREGRAIKLFPAPQKIAGADLSSLRTTVARKQTLIAFSRAVADGQLSLESTQDVDGFMREAMAIRGIGKWSASYMALKVLRHTDAFPGTDLILARALVLHPKEVLERMSPWRGYAAALFWREYASVLKKEKPAGRVKHSRGKKHASATMDNAK